VPPPDLMDARFRQLHLKRLCFRSVREPTVPPAASQSSIASLNFAGSPNMRLIGWCTAGISTVNATRWHNLDCDRRRRDGLHINGRTISV
jgi:hypothetical protein